MSAPRAPSLFIRATIVVLVAKVSTLTINRYVLTLFLDVVKIANALRLWDYIVVRGALVAVPELTLGILHCLKDKIMKDSDEHSLYNILNHSVDVQFIDSI